MPKIFSVKSYVLSSGFGGEHGEDSGAAADVEHNLALEEVLVVPHGVAVGESPHFVLQHFFVNTKMRIRVEIVVFRSHFLVAQVFQLLVSNANLLHGNSSGPVSCRRGNPSL